MSILSVIYAVGSLDHRTMARETNALSQLPAPAAVAIQAFYFRHAI